MKSYKTFKIIIVLLIIFSVTMSGCKTPDNTTNTEKPKIELSGFTQVIPVFILMPESGKPNDEDISDWKDYIKNKYDMGIDLQYVDYIFDMETVNKTVSGQFGIDTKFFEDLETKEGFIKIIDPGDLDKLAKSGLIIPLNDYLGQVPVVSVMDDKVLNRFSDSDGNLWAFPDSGNMYMMHRVYNKKWLDDAGFDVPSDIWDFLEYARYIAKGDPDGNGKNDTFIQDYSANSIAYSFGDIFNAFGCYFDSNMPISYNPLIGEYENVAANENFKNALGFILKMKDEELSHEYRYNYVLIDEDAEPIYMVASQSTSIDVPEYFDGWEFGSCLSGNNSIALGLVNVTRTGFAVLKDTASIVDVMNAIVSVTDSIQGHCDFQYGREGYNYTIDGKRINFDYVYNESEVRMPIRFGTGYYNIHENGYYVVRQSREVSDEYIEHKNELYRDVRDYEAGLLNTDLVYSIPFGAGSSEILALNFAVMDELNELFEDIFEDNIDIDEAIEAFIIV